MSDEVHSPPPSGSAESDAEAGSESRWYLVTFEFPRTSWQAPDYPSLAKAVLSRKALEQLLPYLKERLHDEKGLLGLLPTLLAEDAVKHELGVLEFDVEIVGKLCGGVDINEEEHNRLIAVILSSPLLRGMMIRRAFEGIVSSCRKQPHE